jgi:hypothetical protein
VLKLQGALNKYFEVDRYISLKDQGIIAPPEAANSSRRTGVYWAAIFAWVTAGYLAEKMGRAS